MNRRGAIALTLVIISCGGQPSAVQPSAPTSSVPSPSPTPSLVLQVPAERPTLKTYPIAPQDTDAAIEAPRDPHFIAFDSGAPSRGQLFLFLRGMAGVPADTSLIVRQAAANGFHAVGLAYPNVARLLDLCEKNADEQCFEKVRLETIDGQDRTPLLTITRPNSVINRLTKLIAHLATRFPSDGWSAYIDGEGPRWSKVRLGGQSEGGTHVALIARDHEVARLCMLESPVDLIGAAATAGRRVPPWIASARMTPVDRHYGVRHLRSSSVNAAAFAQAWTAFGMDRFGPAVATDTASPPYGGSHHLTTDAEPSNDGRPNLSHRSVAYDSAVAKTPSGQPVLAPAWQYACFS
jgi:hypothetical protein